MFGRLRSRGPLMQRPRIDRPAWSVDGDVATMPQGPSWNVRPVPLGRVDLLRDVQPGDEILVWAHDRQSTLEPEADGELWKHGTVVEIEHAIGTTTWRNTSVVFEGGKRVFAMPQAKTFLVARHGVPTRAAVDEATL